MNNSIVIKNIGLVVGALLLLIALADGHAYSYFTLLRIVVCGVSVFVATLAYRFESSAFTWLFGFVAFLFNPLMPIHLTREIWVVIDVLVAVFFIFSVFLLKPRDA